MRKFIYTLSFLLIPSLVWAIECNDPFVCVKKASEMCTEKSLKLLGEDECLKCDCPKDLNGNQGILVERDGTKTCCFNGNTWGQTYKRYPNSLYNPDKCGCPEGGEKKEGEDFFGRKICCKNGKKWDIIEEKYKKYDLTCGCAYEWKKYIDGKELCCTNDIPARSPVCPPEKGVPMILDIFDGICGCGCETDDDCNTDRVWYQFLKKRRMCSSDKKCIKNIGCHQFGNLTIELEERDDHELKPEHLPALAAKLKSKMGLEPDEHVRLVINSFSCPVFVGGFSQLNDSTTIYVDIKHCCEISDGDWTCEGTVLHENEHRQDNYKQPIWQKDLKSKIAKAFADNLTEINAHAKDDIVRLTQSYRLCFDKSNNFKDICKVDPKSHLCNECSLMIPSYLRNFNTPEYAKKYHDDPSYFDPDGGCKGQSYNTCRCRGIRLEVEQKYTNSDFNRRTYVAGQAVKNASCGSATESSVQEDLRNIIEALAECKGWERPPREDLTDLPKLLAQLYKEKNELCMSAEEIAKNANIAKGLEGLETCSVIHDFLQANANADLNNLPTTCECEKVTLTSD